MALADATTALWPYGGPGCKYGSFTGKAQSPPSFSGPIPNISETESTGTHSFDLGQYFTGATSYSIAPAVETGWTFDTVTGELEIDTDAVGVFGPFVVTGTNLAGSDDSNAFSVTVTAAPVVEQPEGGDDAWKYQGKLPKQKDYRPEIDERRKRERAELRETLERAAGLLEDAEALVQASDSTELAQQVGALRSEFNGLRSEASAAAREATQARVDRLIALAVDGLVLQIADLLTELIQEIAEDEI